MVDFLGTKKTKGNTFVPGTDQRPVNFHFVFVFHVRLCLDTPYRTRKQKTEQDFPSSYWNPRAVPSVVMAFFLFAAYTRKNVFFANSTSPLPGVLASQDTGHHLTWRACAPLRWELRVLAAMFEGSRWSVSRGLAWNVGAWPVSTWFFFLVGIDLFCVAKSWYRTGSAPHAPSETSGHRPPITLKLGSEDSQLSGAYALQVWWWLRVLWGEDSRQRRSAMCEKHVFFAAAETEREQPEPCVGFNTTKGKTVLFSVFRSHNCRLQRKLYTSLLPGQITRPYRMEKLF